jgi:predicted transposase YdaD
MLLTTGGVGTLPLAPISNVSADQLPEIVSRMRERLGNEATEQERRELWSATYILMGISYQRAQVDILLRGVVEMKDSVTYQAILDEGRVEGRIEGQLAGERRVILRQGKRRFGVPSPAHRAMLERISSLERLEALSVRLLEVESWEELLAETPVSSAE